MLLIAQSVGKCVVAGRIVDDQDFDALAMERLRNSAKDFFDRAFGVVRDDENEKAFPAKVDTSWFRLQAHGGTWQLELRQ